MSAARAGRAARLLPRILLGAVVVALALGYAFGALRERREAREAQPQLAGEARVSGLGGAVQIIRDGRGIPHVEAGSESDALLGLGFVQAQDRIGQMVWLRASARGRAAELVGEKALAADRQARTVGIGRLADAQAARLDAPTRAALEAFAAGVNAYLARVQSGAEPLPLSLRGYEEALAPWQPGDSLAVVKLEAWALGDSMGASLLLADLIESLGGFAARPYFPDAQDAPAVPPPVVPGLAGVSESPRFRDPASLRAAVGLDVRGAGSSAIVVGPRGSTSARPLVAGDAHTATTVPARFYEAHVRGGDLDVAGAMLPGAPVVWRGHNRSVAWASSFAPAVVADLYIESLDPDGSNRYRDGRGVARLDERIEVINVRGGPSESLRVLATRHGPLVNDLVGGDRPPLALAWTGALPGDGVTGLLRAAHARNASEFRAALRLHDEPVLAFAYGDAGGAGGIQLAGAIPRRRLRAGLVPVPGRTADYDWAGTIAPELLPHVSAETGQGFAVASDGVIGAPDASGEIEWLWRPGETQARLESLLQTSLAAGPLDVGGLAQLQLDVGSPGGPALAKSALALAGDPSVLGKEDREVAEALSRWNGGLEAESAGASVYQVFLQRLVPQVLEARLGENLARRYQRLPQTSPVTLVAAWLEAAAAAKGEADPARAQLSDAVRRSLRETWLWLNVRIGPNREKWAWGRLHELRFRPIGLFPQAAAEDAALGPFAYGGDGATVAEGGYDLLAPFDVRAASTHRFAVDAAQLDQAITALVPGQSSHPGSVHLTDGVRDWIGGRPRLLLTSRLLVGETAQTTLWLRP